MSVDTRLARHGHLSYLEIPALDIEQSAAFYEAVFGWKVERRGSGSARHNASIVTNQFCL
jgi:predicted enzyme related to lactoylglutathione lyase